MSEEDPVPIYSAEDTTGGIDALIAAALERGNINDVNSPPQIQIPITQFPPRLLNTQPSLYALGIVSAPYTPLENDPEELQARIIDSFHSAVRSKNVEAVMQLVSAGLVSPDVPNATGCTPLLAAVDAGDATMVRCLIQLGSEVNALATWDDLNEPNAKVSIATGSQTPGARARQRQWRRRIYRSVEQAPVPQRTALQLAAARGNLVVVRLLVEEFSADDSVVAPDGQIALRLAADGGHRDVVDYLPSRRAGSWLRWKTQHAVAVRRIRKAGHNLHVFVKLLFWQVPVTLLYDCPRKCILEPMWKACKWCWTERAKFPGWCKRQVKLLPERIKKAGKGMARGVGRAARGTIRTIKKIPQATKKVCLKIWHVIKKMPAATKIAFLLAFNTLKHLGKGFIDIVARVLSVIHTVLSAVIYRFRNIKLQDIVNGIQAVFRAIFIELPTITGRAVVAGFGAIYDMLKTLFGTLGKMLFWIGFLVVRLFTYAPEQILKMMLWSWKSLQKGLHEILVWFNPKL